MEQEIRSRILEKRDTARGILALSAEKLELTADAGGETEVSFIASSENGRSIEGFVCTDEPRFRVLVPHFFGAEEEIGFAVRTEGVRAGDRIEGHLHVISDGGEKSVRVIVTIRPPYPVLTDETGAEEMKNLFHFANLARRNFDEATRLFYSPRMLQLFSGADKKHIPVYRGLSGTDEQSPDKGASVEEFLIAVRKKDPIEYTVDRTELIVDNLSEDTEETIRITRRGWGYTDLTVRTEGDFLEIRRENLADRDFLGNICNLPVVIRYEALHAGKNTGRIILYNAYTRIEAEVVVHRADEPGSTVRKSEHKERQSLEMQLIRGYVAYRLGKMRSREWLIETGKIISSMNSLAPDDVRFQLYTAQYLITASRENEAIWVLDKIRTSVEETCAYGETMRAYFLYLETLLSREEIKISAVEEILLGMLARDPDNWRIAWLLQFLFDDRTTGNAHRMRLYEEQFLYGCRSPILYIETVDLMGRDPSLLKKIDEFTLYVLAFAARHASIPKQLIDRVVWLLLREKKGSPRIYRILKACYEADRESGAVDAICSLLIKDARTDEEAFLWYREGVLRDSRITRLYEYYMSAHPMPADGADVPEIPRQVLLYFSYKCELDFDKTALLYRYIIAHRESEQELYRTYVPQMERFVSEQMAKGRIDRNLSILYAHFCVLQPADPVSAERFFEALHMTQIRIPDPSIRRIVVVYSRLCAERCYPVMGGVARFPLYGTDAAVLYEDDRGRRYVHEKRKLTGGKAAELYDDNLAKNMDPQMYSEVLPFLREGNANVNLYLTEADRLRVDTDNADRYRRLAESEVLEEKSRNEISRALIRFYYDHDFIRQLADYLPHSHPERMSGRDRMEVLEIMVLSGIYDQAFAMIDRFGLDGVEEKTAYRLCSRAAARGDFPETAASVMLAAAAFRMGKYDESILTQLVRNYQGPVREEMAIWRACGSFSVEAMPLMTRMISQLIFTGMHESGEDKLFREFVRGDGPSAIEGAWLERAASESLYGGTPADPFLAGRVRALHLSGEELPAGSRLYYLKYHASPGAKEDDPEVTEAFLSMLTEAETAFPFLNAYAGRLPSLALSDGMRYVQQNGTPGTPMTIYVRKDGEAEYLPCRMKEPYPGIYTHGVILFPGERACWYVTAKRDGTERLIAGGTVSRDLAEDVEDGETRYALTARLVKAKTQNDRTLIRETLYTLYKNEFLSGKLFPLPEE